MKEGEIVYIRDEQNVLITIKVSEVIKHSDGTFTIKGEKLKTNN